MREGWGRSPQFKLPPSQIRKLDPDSNVLKGLLTFLRISLGGFGDTSDTSSVTSRQGDNYVMERERDFLQTTANIYARDTRPLSQGARQRKKKVVVSSYHFIALKSLKFNCASTLPPPPVSWELNLVNLNGLKSTWVNLESATWVYEDRTRVMSRVLIAALQFNPLATKLWTRNGSAEHEMINPDHSMLTSASKTTRI